MYIEKDVINKVKDVSILDFCTINNIDIINKEKYQKFYKVPNNGGLFIKQNGKSFYKFTDGKKGGIIDFVMLYYNESFNDATKRIIDSVFNGIVSSSHISYVPSSNTIIEEKSQIELPQIDNNVKKIFAYLVSTRKIDKDIVSENIRNHNIMQVIHKGFSNVAFVGYDKDNNIKDMTLRSIFTNSSFKHEVNGSNKNYGFVIDYNKESLNAKDLYVFESAIDCLSHATLYKMKGIDYKKDIRLSNGGCIDKHLERYINEIPKDNIKEIIFCLDNDYTKKENIGQISANRLLEKYEKLGYKCRIEAPKNKDWNEDLIEICNSNSNMQVEDNEELEI